jgi:hypothetical protein
MGVSRQTFGRIIAEARGKVARMLVYGQALHIEGGNVDLADDEHHVTCHGVNDCDGSCMEFPEETKEPKKD